MNICIINGSVFGAAEELAKSVATSLSKQSHKVRLKFPASCSDMEGADAILIITSTTGQGDLPNNLKPFFLAARETMPQLSGKPFGIIALGDSSYQYFAGAGDKMQTLMFELQGKEALPMLKVDATETLDPESLAAPWLTQWLSKL